MAEESNNVFWVGIDWGDTEHACVIVDRDRRVQGRFCVPHSPEGLDTITAKLRAYSPLGGVAVESNRGLLITHLLQQGFTVYSINPKLSHAWRKNDSVSECKSDGRDGRVLAQELCGRHKSLKPMERDEEHTRELALLCEDEVSLIQERTRMVQGLRSTLKLYFPAALDFFTDWTAPAAWAWLRKFSTPKKFAKASEARLYTFLKKQHIGISPTWQERVQKRAEALQWPHDPASARCYEMRALQLAARLQVLETQLEGYRDRINALYEAHEDAGLFKSLPGAGEKLAPRLLSIFGTDRERYDSADPLRKLSGTAPVTKESGRKIHIHFRWACRKHWRNTLHIFAGCSKKSCPWAKAYYEHRRAHGDNHALALRKLADKWLKIIYCMWQTGSYYDDQRHMEQLRRKESPCLTYIACE